jgi:hypothetical protein
MTNPLRRGSRSKQVVFSTLASRIRAIHGGNFSRDSGPFEFPSQGFAAANMQLFFPLEQLIGEPKVRLDNNVESAGANVTTEQRHNQPQNSCQVNGYRCNVLCFWKTQIELLHYLCYADRS